MYSRLATPAAAREVMSRHGIEPKKGFGQNFLIDDNVVGKILDLADVHAGDNIVEIGPGIGTLTSALLDAGARVVAIERDPDLPPILQDTLSNKWDSVNLILKDALHAEACDFACGNEETGQLFATKLVANLPYAVAATIVLDYFQRFDFIESMTVMVQKEVAERMQARPGTKNYGAYTVKLAMYAQSSDSFLVKPACFLPAPHVDSMVIRLNRVEACELGATPLQVRVAGVLADAAFHARRKTILNSMKQYFAGCISAPENVLSSLGDQKCIEALLEKADIDPKTRGETLSPGDFLHLADVFTTSRGSIPDMSTKKPPTYS